jgi:hypothetical protein
MSSFNMDYPVDSFQQPKKSNTGRNLMLACGGLGAIVLLCCCCCLVILVFALRQPVGVVTAWGGFMQQESLYDLSEMTVCEGSQAAQLTNEMIAQKALLSNFSATQNAGSDVITATANITVNGQTSDWAATFTVTDGGSFPFSNCINQIKVTSGSTIQ